MNVITEVEQLLNGSGSGIGGSLGPAAGGAQPATVLAV